MSKKPNNFFTADKIFGLTAMLISLVTLIIFVRQTNIMDKQSRLSALPYLMVEQSTNSSEFKVQFTLVNHGVGPAIIEGRKIVYNGKEYDQDFHQFMTQSIPELKDIKPINWHNIYQGQAIPSNGRVVMFAIGGDEEKFNEFMNVLSTFKDSNTFEFEFDYRSVYGDKWRITNQNSVPVAIE